MPNYNITIDLMKLHGASIEEVKIGRRVQRCVCIPLEPNAGPMEESGSSCFLSLAAFELATKLHGQSHFVKIALPRRLIFGMDASGIKNIPYIGNMRPWAKFNPERCKCCSFAEAASYSNGAAFTRCSHPLADMTTTRDIRILKRCPKTIEEK